MKKGFRYIKYIVVGLLLLFLVAILLVQLPGIQTSIIKKVNQSLSEKLGNQISVQKVDIDFFNRVNLSDIYLEDLQGDTLVYIQSIEVKASLLGLIQNELIITEAKLKGADIQAKLDPSTKEYNFQFLVDAFTPQENLNDTTALKFDLNKLYLEDNRFYLEQANSQLDIVLKEGTLNLDFLDINNKKIIAEDILLEDIQVKYSYEAGVNQKNNDLQFTGLPWQIEVANFDTEQLDIIVKEKHSKRQESIIAFNDLNLSDVNMKAKDIKLDSIQMSGLITQLSLKEKSGFQLDKMDLEFNLTDHGINLPNINVETPQSKINGSTFLTFEEFSNLNNIKKIRINSDFDNTNIQMKDLRFFSDLFSNKGFANISSSENVILDGQLIGDIDELSFQNVKVKVPGIITTKLNGKLYKILNKDELAFNLLVKELKTSSEKLSSILPEGTLPSSLNTFGLVDLSGKFDGTLQSISVDNFDFNSSANTNAKFSGQITNVLDPDQLRLKLQIEKLNTHLDDLKGFIKGDLPPSIAGAGAISYEGNYTGSLKEFELDGELYTDIGNAVTDVQLKFDNKYKSASYSGAIQLENFDLGSVLNNDDFGNASLSIDADGAGLDLRDLNSEMNVKVTSLSYKNVIYENFTFSGMVNQKKFNGDFKIDNTHAIAEFTGLLDLSGEEPEMDFKLDVDTLALLPMNLSSRNISMSGVVQINGIGNSLDDFLGNLDVNEFKLRVDTMTYQSDSLIFISSIDDKNNKNLIFNTDGIEASIKGDYRLTQIPIYFKDIVDYYIPVQWLVEESNAITPSLDTKEIFSIGLEVKDESFLRLFAPKLYKLEDLSLYAYLNSDKESLLLNGSILALQFDKYKTKNIDLFSQNKDNSIENEILFDSLTGISNITLPINNLKAILQKDKLTVNLNVENDSLANILSLGGNLTNEDGLYNFKFDEVLKLDSANWTISKENSIQFKNDYLYVNSLRISKDLQSLLVQSDNAKPLGNTPLNVLLANFDIHELTNLMAFENDYLYGIADANILIQDIFSDPRYSGDLFAKEIILNKNELGDINLSADKRKKSSILDLDISVDGKGNYAEGKGTLDLATNALRFESTFKDLDITIFEPFIEKIVSDSKGSVNGNISINGTEETLIINGSVTTNELSTIINFSNTNYQIDGQTVLIEDSKFIFDNMLLKDLENRKAFLNGSINHTNFKDFYYDLSVNTEAFQILNTSVEENPLFYGNLILNADASIKGPLNLPNIKVNASSLKGTEFHLSPFTESETVIQDDYIIFTNNSAINPDSLEGELYQLTNNLPLDLELTLDVGKDTKFQFILDPKSGDKLTCFGDANLQVNISPDGQINVFGQYTVDSGKYNFSYGKLIYKEFDLVKGGSVIFQGDPLLARLDVETAYNTKATPLAIIEDKSSLSETEVSRLQKRTEVQVALDINGTIRNPDLDFDLSFVNSDIQQNPNIDRRLNEIRSDQEQLYNQVFGLIIFDSFVDASVSGSIVQNTGNIALSSVSSLVEDRLNKLTDKFIKGFDLIVNVDSYNTDYINDSRSTSVTEFGVGASKSFFNNRLTLKALGNVDVDNRSSHAAFSSIAGDFILQYKLNKKGNITLEAFRKSDFDVLLEENTNKNGIGISLQKALYLRNKSNN